MIRALIPLLRLTGCATTQSAVSCDNADRVRAAAALALTALDRVCPSPVLTAR